MFYFFIFLNSYSLIIETLWIVWNINNVKFTWRRDKGYGGSTNKANRDLPIIELSLDKIKLVLSNKN